MSNEVKMHTTVYWTVPSDYTAEEWIAILKTMPKDQALDLGTDYADSVFLVD